MGWCCQNPAFGCKPLPISGEEAPYQSTRGKSLFFLCKTKPLHMLKGYTVKLQSLLCTKLLPIHILCSFYKGLIQWYLLCKITEPHHCWFTEPYHCFTIADLQGHTMAWVPWWPPASGFLVFRNTPRIRALGPVFAFYSLHLDALMFWWGKKKQNILWHKQISFRKGKKTRASKSKNLELEHFKKHISSCPHNKAIPFNELEHKQKTREHTNDECFLVI